MPCLDLPLENGRLSYYPQFLLRDEADALLDFSLHQLAWRHDDIVIAGRRIPIPRLQNYYGDTGTEYAYSRIPLTPLPWPDPLRQLAQRLETLCEQRFNAVLANQYRDGRDSVDWHSDDEAVLGTTPVIASVSLGAPREFQLKSRGRLPTSRFKVTLAHGSLLVMHAPTQQYWLHRLPKAPWESLPRVNFTFRHIVT